MAHLRKKARWPIHAQAMIEGKSLAKTAELCGVHPTTAFRWRHRFLRAPADDKPRTLSGIVEADGDLHPRILQGPVIRSAAKGAKARWKGPAIQAFIRITFPSSSRATGKGATFDAVLPQVDGVSVRTALAGVVTVNHRIGDGGRAIAAFARKAGIPFHGPCPRPESRPARRLICTSTTSTPITAVSSKGWSLSKPSQPKTCQAISAGDAH
jgi:Homeodomain-like domain